MNNEQKWNFSRDKMPDHNIVLVAHWTEQLYTVTYDLNGGKLADGETTFVDKNKYHYDEIINEPDEVKMPLKEGYKFNSYELLDEEGNLVSFIFGQFKMPARNIIIQAQWVVDTGNLKIVNFDLNGGNQISGKLMILIKIGQIIGKENVPGADRPKSNGSTIESWYYNNRIWDLDNDKMPSHDITLVAHWTSYYLTYEAVDDAYNTISDVKG